MKLLLSAYACEPHKGSEPGVGWHWAHEIEKLGHQVWVLTRENNQQVIGDYYQKNAQPENIQFIYFDLPKWLSWWKKGGRGVHLYYLLWQIGAYLKARQVHKTILFDQVQHITFVTVRQPSFMGLLGIPFIFGPVGGGERAPYALRRGFGIRGWLKDFARDVANFMIKFDPLMHLTFLSAARVCATSEQSRQLIPFFYRHKVNVQLAIGFDVPVSDCFETESQGSTDGLKLLYVGRFEYWKGMGLGIQAFAKLFKQQPGVTLTMVGKGPDKGQWQALAKKLNVADKINWIEWVDQNALKQLYQEHDVFLFPSLHDSGGMVVLEAMFYGLPVVCLELGGPGVIVNEKCGVKVAVAGCSEAKLVEKISGAISLLIDNKGNGGVDVETIKNNVLEKSWSSAVRKVYENSSVINNVNKT